MESNLLFQKIKSALPQLDLREGEPMSEHTSFRIGGPARLMAIVKSEDEVLTLSQILRDSGAKTVYIGRGTNLLVSDSGLDAVVVKLSPEFDEMSVCENVISAQSGVSLARLAVFAQQNSLSGLEFAHGIPGSLGGAIFMNAGAYGGEMRDVIKSVIYLDSAGKRQEIDGAQCDFSYRHSRFSEGDVILGARLELKAGDANEILAQMKQLYEKRSSSQPLNFPSGGSTFKRPESGYAAAMIDEAGLKGFQIGGAMVSEKHAGFVINAGGATFEDVTALMAHIQNEVRAKFSVELQPELRILR